MKKVVLSVVAALAVTAAAPAFAADMPVKAYTKAPAPAPSPWDIAFGTAFTTDYILRGITQTNHNPAVQGYFELDYSATPWLTMYAGLWGSSLWSGTADAEFDLSGGGRLSFGKFGLDLGYVFYGYPDPTAGTNISYGEVYAKPSYKVTDWLTLNGTVIGGSDWGSTGNNAWYYEGGAAIALPQFMPWSIGTTLSGAIGRQTYASALAINDYTTWNAGLAFNYKAVTLDLRYYDTDLGDNECVTNTGRANFCHETFVATLKFDTTLSALK